MGALNERPGYVRLQPVARIAGLILILTFVCHVAFAHPELQLQIDQLTARLALEPDNVGLLLKRGDLQRRHESPELARADFNRVRRIQPDNQTVDWFEGRLEVQTGDPREGIRHLNRFLLSNPGHVIALQNRAQGYLLLNQPLLAAKDYQAVIRESDNASPSIYGASALAFIAAGADHYSRAMDVIAQGLLLFPTEVTLTGIATDLSLVQSDVDSARRFVNSLPAAIRNLPQWQTRIALLDCQTESRARAKQWFSGSLAASVKSPNANRQLSDEWLTRLAVDPSVKNCQAAAVEILNSRW